VDDRIKLAEAMGWERIPNYWKHGIGLSRHGWKNPTTKSIHSLGGIPSPFTDANDDYDVLEWARSKSFDYFEEFAQEVYSTLKAVPVHYTIGDYARAALKVIDNAK